MGNSIWLIWVLILKGANGYLTLMRVGKGDFMAPLRNKESDIVFILSCMDTVIFVRRGFRPDGQKIAGTTVF